MASVADLNDPAFDAVAWVNNVLAPARSFAPSVASPAGTASADPLDAVDTTDALDATDAALAAHARALDDAAADAHAALGAALTRALAAVPWAVREADRVRQRAAALRAGVDGVGERVAGVETAVSTAVAAVAHADTLLRRVEAAADLLAQAARADTLLDRLDALLASSAADGSDLVSAADVIAELRATLEPLRPIPDLAPRFEQLDTADKKLETLATPRLREALRSRNAAAASNARIVFDRAGRDNAFATHYVSIRATQVAELWSAAWSNEASAASDLTAEVHTGRAANAPAQTDSLTSELQVSTENAFVSGRSSSNARGSSNQLASGASADLASTQAAMKLDGFYEQLVQFLRVESDWLAIAFPELRPRLLPALLASALLEPSSPSFNDIRPFPGSLSSSGTTRLHNIALRSVRAAAEIARLLQEAARQDITAPRVVTTASPCSQPALARDALVAHDVVDLVQDALSAVLFPCRVFWELWPAIAARNAEHAALEIPLDSTLRVVTFSEIAKAIEAAQGPLLDSLDVLIAQIRDWTVGLGVSAIPGASATSSAVLSRRVLALVRQDSLPLTDNAGVDWSRVAGALRLLNAVSSLKAAWETRKESGVAASAASASSLLEEASIIKQSPISRISVLVACADEGRWAEACALWELVRDDSLSERVTRAFEGIGDRSDDLNELLENLHRLVYDSMFIGIQQRLDSFSTETTWSEEIASGEEHSILGFSSSPLPYATDIADYLMTIPQQLEPFVPEDDGHSNLYAMPLSVYAFTEEGPDRNGLTEQDTSSPPRDRSADANSIGVANAAAADIARSVSNAENLSRSFAAMWIGAVAIGTIELYVQKICSIPRLGSGGARQLAIDIEYICNVLAALGVSPTENLELVRQLVECEPDAKLFKDAADSPEQASSRRIRRRLAAMRDAKFSE